VCLAGLGSQGADPTNEQPRYPRERGTVSSGAAPALHGASSVNYAESLSWLGRATNTLVAPALSWLRIATGPTYYSSQRVKVGPLSRWSFVSMGGHAQGHEMNAAAFITSPSASCLQHQSPRRLFSAIASSSSSSRTRWRETSLFSAIAVIVLLIAIALVPLSYLFVVDTDNLWKYRPVSLPRKWLSLSERVGHAPYTVQVFSVDPLILYIHDFLNQDEIQHVLTQR
jgi:hypothetical protein